MHKILILFICLYSLSALAELLPNNACALGIEKLTPNTLTFIYTPQANTDTPLFYIKAITGNENPAKTIEDIMATGKNLALMQNVSPPFYRVPDHTKKLYIVRTKSKTPNLDPLAQIMVEADTKKNHNSRNENTRNASNFIQDRLPETKLSASSDAMNICEINF